MLTISNLEKAFGARTLFSGASLQVNRGERFGLVGPNGAGKTTLFSIVLGQMEADAGQVELMRGTSLGYLPQESAPSGEETVLELASGISPEIALMQRRLREHPDPADPEHQEAQMRWQEIGGPKLLPRAQKILSQLAFRESDFFKPAHTLSGGWVMRAHLARLLLMEPDLLMLDEPTNHLDLETLGWFQQHLSQYPGAILTISHDRAFLNGICDHH
ncbi:MAG: ATP-binding cassette domain-containing protein, partial [Verrucomicrobiota bacterium]